VVAGYLYELTRGKWEEANVNVYRMLGLCLALAGLLLSCVSYFVLNSIPLTALGISTLILASISFAIGTGQPKIPPEASILLLQSGTENISALVEELGLKSKAVYLPGSMTSGKSQALIPLYSNPYPPQFGKTVFPKRLIVKHGSNPEDMGLLITTPGSTVSETITSKPDATEADLESTLTMVLSGTLNLADSAKITIDDDTMHVEVSNPRLENQKMWIYESLGTPLASIVASVIAQVIDKPVVVEEEQALKGKSLLKLKMLGRNL
jgi:hypothetical protein